MASGPAKRKTAQGSVTPTDHPHLDALIKGAGHIMIGAIEPVRNVTLPRFHVHQIMLLSTWLQQ